MALSLQEQLLKAGVVDQKKAKQIKQDQRKQTKQQPKPPKGQALVNETAERVQQAKMEKIEKDRLANQVRNQEAEKKALQAQVKQIIETHRIGRKHGEVSYQFVDNTKIKKLHVTQAVFDQLTRGQVGIARYGEQYELVPRVIAEKILLRDASAIVKMPEKATEQSAVDDDPYAAYQIPDDLMW